MKFFKRTAGAVLAGAIFCIGLGIGMVNAYAVEINGNGTESAPYIIQNEAQLLAMADGELPLDAYYRLDNNIVLTAENWTPIGAFSGTFDGTGCTISNLNVESDAEYVGLFGKNDGVIKNLNVRACSIKETVNSDSFVGVIAGFNTKNIENCSVSGTVSCSDDNENYFSNVGGITGKNNGELTKCRSACAFIGSCDYLGGITGTSAQNGLITGCEFTGTIGDETEYYNASIAGGIVGWSISDITECASEADLKVNAANAGGICGYAYNCNISRCYSVGNITNAAQSAFCNAGGSLGYAEKADIKDCFSIGDVTAASGNSTSYAGGFAGMVYIGAVSNCYCSGEVKGDGDISAFANNDRSSVSGCYYNKSVENIAVDEFATALIEERMMNSANFASWDFDSVWSVNPKVNDGFPYLRALPDGAALNVGVKCMQYGDVNVDEKLTAADCSVILSKVLNDAYVMPVEEKADAALVFHGDVNADNKLTAADSSVLLQKVLNDAYRMPIEM